MKCHILFSEKNKKNISKCRLLKILPRVLSVKPQWLKLPISRTQSLSSQRRSRRGGSTELCSILRMSLIWN